jgi:hypothetical protein
LTRQSRLDSLREWLSRRSKLVVGFVVGAVLLGITQAITGGVQRLLANVTTEIFSHDSSAPAPFRSEALYDFARYLFDPGECHVPGPSEAPLLDKLDPPFIEGVKCESGSEPYAGTFFCTKDVQELVTHRGVFLRKAVPMSEQRVTGSPAGKDEAVDGIQMAFIHKQKNSARVYWDSQEHLCAGELQAHTGDKNVTAITQYWHDGKSS